ncbi:MAG: hypothetical protein ACK41T_04340 [Pseudobdellovibrio sp.]
MDFELKHLDMIQSETSAPENSSQNGRRPAFPSSHHQTTIQNTSMVLDELYAQVEELQNKIKVNHKKLLLYEAENQKLIQEKNSLYFEHKVTSEHNAILTDKNKKLLKYTEELEIDAEKHSHRIEIAEKLIQTQKTDLNRLSKFHLKVKNIIKPFVDNLKKQNAHLHDEIATKNTLISQHELYQKDLENKISALENEKISLSAQFQSEKTALIQSYEEQIHFLSKEIVEQQEIALNAQNENLRLKKQCETKLFIENELVKYKRVQDEHIQTINSLRLKENDLKQNLTELNLQASENNTRMTQLTIELDNQTQLLEATRKQLSSKITEIENLNLRLKMLEKLNTSLSLNLKDSQT